MMKKYKTLLYYISVSGILLFLMYFTIINGQNLEDNIAAPTHRGRDIWILFKESLLINISHPLAILLTQIVTIILTARIFSWVCKKIGQPTVIGEILAGIMLGPSFLGHYFPEYTAWLFPAASLGNLQFLSQIGLILFMFVIGLELDVKLLKNRAQDAVVISHASILLPFTLGIMLAYLLYNSFAPKGISFASFALFQGIAMSITAFPVLARIIQERGIHKTKLGALVITCAAADDVTAWCLLAMVIAIVKAGSFTSAIFTILLAVAYVLLMLKVVRPFLKRIGDLNEGKDTISRPLVAVIFLTLLISAYLTEVIGIHALFGAFMTGAIMPDSFNFRSLFIEKVEDVALVLLLPLFFVYTGLRTEIGLLNEPYLIMITIIIILVAVTGKFVGSAITARFVGQSWKDSFVIGALMNTRGLMELVVLNIGYDLGVLSPEIFAMMVIMALVTTIMTGPSLDLIDWFFKDKNTTVIHTQTGSKFRIILAFGTTESGKSLLKLANLWIKKPRDIKDLTVIHVSHTDELHPNEAVQYEEECFEPLMQTAKENHLPFTSLFKISSDIETEITEVANKGKYNLLIAGMSNSIYEGSLLGKFLGFTTSIFNPDKLLNKVTGKEKLLENSPFDGTTNQLILQSEIPVAIFIDKDFEQVQQIFVPLLSKSDEKLIQHLQILAENNKVSFLIQDTIGNLVMDSEFWNTFCQQFENSVRIKVHNDFDIQEILQYQLMIVSIESWKQILDEKSLWIREAPSTVILK